MGISWLVVVIGAPATGLVLVAGLAPRRLWWAVSAWQYRDPQAFEPSAAAYRTQAVLCVAAAAALAVGTVWYAGEVHALGG